MTDRIGKARLTPARMNLEDVARVGVAGLRARPTRAVLSALGIAIGIATMVAVLGISSSSQARVMETLDALGTNMLTVAPGKQFSAQKARLPKNAGRMIRGVEHVAMAGQTGDTGKAIYRNDRIPSTRTGGLQVRATSLDLLEVLQTPVRSGRWHDVATAAQRTVVLGSTAATRLAATAGDAVWINGQWWTVIGVLAESPLAEDVDVAALVGFAAADTFLGFDGHPTLVYTKIAEEKVTEVRALLNHAANPEHPEEVTVSRPSDALAAKAAVAGAFTSLLLGVGGVALLVGGVGIANTMIISVLERRREIGLRRALGATTGQVRVQFLAESLILAGVGGLTGSVLGVVATIGFALTQGLPPVVPAWVIGGGLGATLVVGTIAGLYPAMRAARMSPTLALSA
ncbi:ABC transporter permease [Nonomuraea rubra]|uniref:Putative ABC transport system permease protein n=1 Tax=Nonomuraea rubra TaxID=46180 RepID=A0A7X0U0H4_9ACTN|nr:ABC transporter permease [Nonomuraea rubra]MBB6550742.1 putative ABC transport system permease protein [Nonomuraea rubra]